MSSEHSSRYRTEKGQTLLEVIVVLAVGIIVIGSLVFATITSLRNAQFSRNQAAATKLAQEGIEGVRNARDRNNRIVGLFQQTVTWTDPGLWGATAITNACSPNCYFVLTSSGELDAIGSIPPSNPLPNCPLAECLDNNMFKRVVILADDAGSTNSKLVTVVVTWTDFAGPHESRLTTILRNLNP